MTHAPHRVGILRSPVALGIAIIVVLLLAMVLAFKKQAVGVFLSSGDTVKADFARDYRLVPGTSQVKMNGVVVGTVTDVEKGTHNDVVISMKLDDGTLDKLGSAPTATVRPTTLLGGNYFIGLQQGGAEQRYSGEMIPVQRTSVPVELDQILAAIPPPAQEGIQSLTRQLDGTLANGGSAALGDLLRDAPGALAPLGTVLTAAQGAEPETDLPHLVTYLDNFAKVVTRNDGQLGDIVDSLRDTSSSLSASAQPLGDTVKTLPATLQSTRNGLATLNDTLAKLKTTASGLRPAAQELAPLLAKTNPVLVQARPLVGNLKPLLQKAEPIVQQLVPTVQQANGTLNNLRGPVLDRVNGPIANALNTTFVGTGSYAGDGGNGHLLYQEIGYLGAHGAEVSLYADKNGAMVALGVGVGLSSIGGSNLTLQQLLTNIGALPAGSALPQPAASAQPGDASPKTAPPAQNGSGLSGLLDGLPPLPLGGLTGGSGR